MARSINFYTLGLRFVAVLVGLALLFIASIYYGAVNP